MMPLRIAFTRHGCSGAQERNRRLRSGEAIPDGVFSEHDSNFPLVPQGVVQAQETGLWPGFSQYTSGYVSPLPRAFETAGHLDLPISWKLNYFLRERNWGSWDLLTQEQRVIELGKMRRSPLHHKVVGGEALVDLSTPLHSFFGTLSREHRDDNVAVVCHGEVMLVISLLLERLTPQQFGDLKYGEGVNGPPHNCEIFEYTRVDPITGDTSPHLDWTRRVRWYGGYQIETEWRKIQRHSFSSAQLLEMAAEYPNYF